MGELIQFKCRAEINIEKNISEIMGAFESAPSPPGSTEAILVDHKDFPMPFIVPNEQEININGFIFRRWGWIDEVVIYRLIVK